MPLDNGKQSATESDSLSDDSQQEPRGVADSFDSQMVAGGAGIKTQKRYWTEAEVRNSCVQILCRE